MHLFKNHETWFNANFFPGSGVAGPPPFNRERLLVCTTATCVLERQRHLACRPSLPAAATQEAAPESGPTFA